MLIGEYQHSLDTKGRLIIPSKLRDSLGESFILTRGLDNCLFVYPKEEWNIIEAKLKTLPLTNKDARGFVRFFFSGATECNLDKQGRILIPLKLREYSKIEKEAILIGVGTRMEIWGQEEWDSYISVDNLSYEEIAEQMEDLGI